ncbi:DUF2809 domain-containing protein [Flavobacterium sp. FlaQc-48]|uniref:ribosomal maturation YjgA family protein n=1 Tax=Flavobacterium sp. FlaQc-48 TaxID=3374181 RepID=UPI0037572CE8
MNKSRIYYSITFVCVILLGILSRKISQIPLCTGDFLYAVMLYILFRMVLISKKSWQISILSLITCYGIEFLQLYQAEWIIELRQTLFGRYVLGQGFLWSDILAYTIGVTVAFSIEKIIFIYCVSRGSA